MAYYRAVDDAIGDLWDRCHAGRSGDREGEGFFLLSDHGFTAVRQELRLNAWLREQGYLAYAKDDPATVGDLAPERTQAFALDPGRIYLNTKGRFPRGCVEADAAFPLREEIAEKFRALTYEGQPVVSHLFAREDIFTGPRASLGPDLVLLTHDGFDPKGSMKAPEVFGSTHFQGMHTWDDAFLWSALPVKEDPWIHDVAGVVEGWA
jgi:predicted AlkP superfamily phosphohydrolase/phosphomutase